MRSPDVLFVAGVLATLGVGVVPLSASADQPSSTCKSWDVEYQLAANVELSETTMGAGNGVHTIGPGTVVVRFERREDAMGVVAKMLAYRMKDHFTVIAKALFWETRVTNDTHTTATPDAEGIVAVGVLRDRTLRWTSSVNSLRTDGAVTCDGSLCGKFGAPPEGTSDVHTPPRSVDFKPFEFDADKKTFTMAYAVVSKMESSSPDLAHYLGWTRGA